MCLGNMIFSIIIDVANNGTSLGMSLNLSTLKFAVIVFPFESEEEKEKVDKKNYS